MVGTSNVDAKEFAGAALVVEDDALIALELSDMLAHMGFDPVDVAHASDQAMALLSRVAYAIAILDIKLEIGDGLDIARRMKLNGAPQFVFASGYGVKLPADLSAVPFVHKPFNEAALREAIRLAISGRGVRP